MKRILWITAFALWAVLPALAQHPPGGNARNADPLRQFLFSPEMVMRHQRELGLTDAQREAIKEEAVAAQTRYVALQWELQEAMQEMRSLLAQEQIDEEAALAQLHHILDLERQVKEAQLILGVRIRNLLTPDQRRKLMTLRRRQRRQNQNG